MKNIKKNKKYNWIQDEIELDFVPNIVIQNCIKEAEQYDLENDEFQYFNMAEAIELEGKESHANGNITKEQWMQLCAKYPGEERFV